MAWIILSGLADDGVNVGQLGIITNYIYYASFIVYIIIGIYVNICFKRWMKIKYNVQY